MNKFCFVARWSDRIVHGHLKAPSGSEAKEMIVKEMQQRYNVDPKRVIYVSLLGLTSEPFRVEEIT